MNKPISETIIQDVLNKLDIVDLVGEYVQLKKSGKNYLGLCPFHSEKTPSFSVSPDKQIFHCFGCGVGGNAFSFLMEIEGFTFVQSVQQLAEKVGVDVQLDAPASQAQKAVDEEKQWMLKAHHLVTQLYHHMLMERSEGQKARDYMHKRGFTEETIKHFQIGYAPKAWDFLTRFLEKRQFPLHIMEKAGLLIKADDGKRYFDRFRDRVIFPIWNHQGQVIGFGGRLLGDGHPKYLNSPETKLFQKGKQLYNFHHARKNIRKMQKALLFEGYADVLSAHQVGIQYAVATLGTSLSEEQARVIRRNAEQVYICFDGDQAGLDAAMRNADILIEHGCIVKIALIPDDRDPDEFIQEHGSQAFEQQVLQEAKSVTAFKLYVLRRGRQLNDESQRMAYIQDALQVICQLPRAIERDHYLRQLADEFSLSLDALKYEQTRMYKALKRKQQKEAMADKNGENWHPNKNDRKHLSGRLYPAYFNAERRLLAYMLASHTIADQVQATVGSQFNDEKHNALAAYIYAFYAKGNRPNIQLFLTELDDKELIRLASELSSMEINPELSNKEIQDLMNKILQYPYQLEIDSKEEEKKKAERQGDFIKAATIAMEIIEMKHKMKHNISTTED